MLRSPQFKSMALWGILLGILLCTTVATQYSSNQSVLKSALQRADLTGELCPQEYCPTGFTCVWNTDYHDTLTPFSCLPDSSNSSLDSDVCCCDDAEIYCSMTTRAICQSTWHIVSNSRCSSSTPCGSTAYPECGGYCPEAGQVCDALPASGDLLSNGSCICTYGSDSSSESSSSLNLPHQLCGTFPTCNGVCPGDQICNSIPMLLECLCVPNSSSSSSSISKSATPLGACCMGTQCLKENVPQTSCDQLLQNWYQGKTCKDVGELCGYSSSTSSAPSSSANSDQLGACCTMQDDTIVPACYLDSVPEEICTYPKFFFPGESCSTVPCNKGYCCYLNSENKYSCPETPTMQKGCLETLNGTWQADYANCVNVCNNKNSSSSRSQSDKIYGYCCILTLLSGKQCTGPMSEEICKKTTNYLGWGATDSICSSLCFESSSSSTVEQGACCGLFDNRCISETASSNDCERWEGFSAPGKTCTEAGCPPDPYGACCDFGTNKCLSDYEKKSRCFGNFYKDLSCEQIGCPRSSNSSPSSSRSSSRSRSMEKGACCIEAGKNKLCIAENVTDAHCIGAIHHPGQSCDEAGCPQPWWSSSSSSSLSSSSSSSHICCICLYMDIPECAVTNIDQCESTKDCSMNSTSNDCESQFKKDCREWISSPFCQKANSRLVQADNLPLPDKISSCTQPNMIRMGHGRGCDFFGTRVTECLRKCANAQCSIFGDAGCSTFNNVSVADKWAEAIRVRYAKEGKTITISANQTLAGYPACENRLTYTITVSGTDKKYQACNIGGFCYRTSDPIKCTNSQGTISTVQCCSDGTPTQWGGFWHSADSPCPATRPRS